MVDFTGNNNCTGLISGIAPTCKTCELEVFNAVSADGDGVNDEFRIEGIDCYPDNTVMIFNRWGVKVFELDRYDNDQRAFKGFSEGRVTIARGESLPSGTYFYILEYQNTRGEDSRRVKQSGYLYLISRK